MRSSACPVSATIFTPPSTSAAELEISDLISLAACEDRCASARTSDATTAKSAPRIARPRGFDAGVQREQVGLESDLLDDADDLADLVRRLLNSTNRINRAFDDFAASFRFAFCDGGDIARLIGALGRRCDGRRDLVQGGRGFLDGRRLLFCPSRQVVGGRRNFARTAFNRIGAFGHLSNERFQFPDRIVEAGPQRLEEGKKAVFDLLLQVAVGEPAQSLPEQQNAIESAP